MTEVGQANFYSLNGDPAQANLVSESMNESFSQDDDH